ncbi:MAG: trimeric intracellular cation channel family protein [Hyphomicrobiaceae bacterium]
MNWSALSDALSGLSWLLGALQAILPALDLVAATVFALTGALVASRKQMDIVGFMWLATVTGVGGGTVRDLLLGVPVFWVRDVAPVVACLAAAVVAYFTAHLVHSRYKLILWLDALGMALVTMAGTSKGLATGTGPVVAVVMGVITAAVGGIIRDILGQEPSIILRKEIYVTASLAGAVLYVTMLGAGFTVSAAALSGGAAAFAIRGLSLAFGWSMPTYRARAGRTDIASPVDPKA